MTDAITETARKTAAAGQSAPMPARDPVNRPMINNWVEALGDDNPVYTDEEYAKQSVHGGLVAPPAMVQVWTMRGLHGERAADDPLGIMTRTLDEAGFTGVVATNCEQVYHRYLHEGEQVSVSARLEDVVGPKRTGLGTGYFVTTTSMWYVGDEPVGEMLFRVLKFRPSGRADEGATGAGATTGGSAGETANSAGHGTPPSGRGEGSRSTEPLRPVAGHDTAFFWEGTACGELRIQRCGRCGLLRHPPGPMCPECGATDRTHLVSEGLGEVYSYVVHHHPTMPGRETPYVVALVELDEGVRMVGELTGVDPDEVDIGMAVEIAFQEIDDGTVLPAWSPRVEGSRR